MNDSELKDVQQLQEITNHENEEIARDAHTKLVEIEHELSEKGIFIC